ncbi:MAG: hypothetical protein COB65_13725 [Thalassobium sp.]|nr:MAG: hypothetical protein COB65_13725 [Thalassobium sp.]
MRTQYHCRQVGSDTLIWDIHRLVRLARGIAPHTIPLSDIAEVYENWWFKDQTMIPTPKAIAAHMALVQACDLAHPLILCSEGRLMDGMHRAVKAVLENRRTVQVVQFSQTPEPDFMNVSLDDLPYRDEDL